MILLQRDAMPAPLNYSRASAAARSAQWVCVATFATPAQWHAARTLLERQGITTRLRTAAADGDEMQMEVFATEVEWARALLAGGVPSMVAEPEPAGGFPVSALPPSFAVLPPEQSERPTIAGAAIPVLPLRSLRNGPTRPRRHRYHLLLWVLWCLLIVVAVVTVGVCFIDWS
jgi:hypothetical protein